MVFRLLVMHKDAHSEIDICTTDVLHVSID